MFNIHTIDKDKVIHGLLKRGWRKDQYGGWVRPAGITDDQSNQHWVDSTIEGIVCQHEVRKQETIRLNKEYQKRREGIQ
jgi:hypothetical protein